MSLQSFKFGKTASNLPILGHRFGRQGPGVLILGGVHGNEPEGVIASLGLVDYFQEKFPFKLNVTLVPMFNLDGVMKSERRNSRGVDLNRNLPTKDWTKDIKEEKYFPGLTPCSEPENQALVGFIEAAKPKFILSLHSWHPCLNVNGNCQAEAEVLARMTGYEIKTDIGYPTPGSLGTYSGLEREIPTITYEIERGLGPTPILKTHVPAIIEALKVIEKRFQHHKKD